MQWTTEELAYELNVKPGEAFALEDPFRYDENPDVFKKAKDFWKIWDQWVKKQESIQA